MKIVYLTIAFFLLNHSVQAQWDFLNSPPTIDEIKDYSILENSGRHVITLTGISDGDDDEFQFVTITANSDNNDLISELIVEYNQGETALLIFRLVANENGNAKITVTLNDGQRYRGITTESFEVKVKKVNGKPSFQLSSELVHVEENAGKVEIKNFALNMDDGDPDEDQKLNFKSEVVSQSVSLTFRSIPTIDNKGKLQFEVNNNKYGEALISVVLSDDGGTKDGGIDQSDEQLFRIIVKDINQAPTLDEITSPLIIDEDAGLQTVSLTGISAGKNESQTLSISAQSSNTALISSFNINYQQGASSGSITFSPEQNRFGNCIVTVTVDDGQDENNVVTRQFTVIINPVADTPSITDAIYEGGTFTSKGLVISRNPVDGAEVSHFKITSIENGKLFHNNEVDEILNNSFITYAQASVGLKFAPSIGINNNGSFKVQAATGPQNNKLGGSIIIANIVIDNDPPTILTFPTDTIVEITEPYFYQVIASDPNELDQLTFTIQIPEFIKAWMNIQYDGDNKATMSGTPPSGSVGVYPIYIVVEDQFGLSDDQRFNLHVRELNNRPTISPFSKSIDEDDTIFFTRSDFTSNFNDIDGDSLQMFKLVSLPQFGAVYANGNELSLSDEVDVGELNSLFYIPDKDYFGLDIFDWNASDGEDYALVPQRINVFIESVNDPPEILFFEENPFTFEYAEESIQITDSAEVVDVDGDKLVKAVIEISSNYIFKEDTLFYEEVEELTYDWHDTTGVLTIRGLAPPSIYQEAIRALRYVNLNRLSPNGGSRQIEIVLHDADTASTPYNRQIEFRNTFVALDIPTGFTPNQDGVNDTWNIENLNRYENYNIEVYSRSGQMVFKSSRLFSEWDGSHDGKMVPVGAYYYIISINKFQKVFRGNVSVLR